MSTPNPQSEDSPSRKVLSITSIMNDDSNNTKKEEESNSAPSITANTTATTSTTNPVITPSKKINIMDINSMTNDDQDPTNIPSSPIGGSNIDNASPSHNPHRVST
ncbi:unnamed protein product [[Candida] boidinii]|uniref:Unnamed protein product n=1 Tax=Candida boidinii TaxID=5477 RepID=A0ACB5U595_CANBO|nr:unnamed protein product [[Candida] boidinii]